MKKSLLVIVSLFALFLSTSSDVKNGTEWQLVWSDEFNYNGLPSPTIWSFETDGNSYGWGNGEDQYYTDSLLENARVQNGALTITAIEKSVGGKNYTSARINTKGKFSTRYGRFEARMKLPGGRGIWPAFWLMPEESKFGAWPNSGEIDIVEFFGWRPNDVSVATHTEYYNHRKGNNKGGILKSNTIHDDFHLYAVEWFPDRLDFYYDDQKITTVKGVKNSPSKWPFTEPFYIILNCAVGGDWCRSSGGIANTPFPQEMLIDYVRVYKAKTDKPLKVQVNTVGSGAVSISPQKESYSFGERVTLSAVPDQGQELARWTPFPTGGKVSGNSITFSVYDDERIDAYFNSAGEMLTNGDFGKMGLTGWTVWMLDPKSGVKKLDKGSLLINAKLLTKELWQIQASYAGIKMERGGVYKLSVDAKASKARPLQFGVVQNHDPYNSYSRKNVNLSKNWQTYSFTFTCTEASDPNCRLELDYGGAKGKVWVDNVSLERLK